jgi:hypothetical protein
MLRGCCDHETATVAYIILTKTRRELKTETQVQRFAEKHKVGRDFPQPTGRFWGPPILLHNEYRIFPLA